MQKQKRNAIDVARDSNISNAEQKHIVCKCEVCGTENDGMMIFTMSQVCGTCTRKKHKQAIT